MIKHRSLFFLVFFIFYLISITSILSMDTDNDGLSDNDESFFFNTDPNKNDTDNDGLSDFQETQLSINKVLINTNSTWNLNPSISYNGENYFVVWEYVTGSSGNYKYYIYGKMIDKDGGYLTDEFSLQTSGSKRRFPAITSSGNSFFVAWNYLTQQYDNYDVFGRVYDNTGIPITSPFHVNQYNSYRQNNPHLSSNGSNYFAVWTNKLNYTPMEEIYGRLYDLNGNRLTDEIQINSYNVGRQDYAKVASNGSTYFVIWQSLSNNKLYGQFLDGTGNKIGSEITINLNYSENVENSYISSDGHNYLVVWEGKSQTGDIHRLVGQYFSADTEKIGSEIQISPISTGNHCNPCVESNGISYLVTWDFYPEDGSDIKVYGKLFDNEGRSRSPDFLIGEEPNRSSGCSRIASTSMDYCVAWYAFKSSDSDVYTTFLKFGYGTDALNPDTDNDGLKDGEEVNIYQTNPTLFDTDTDSISDGEELLLYNTNPLNPDTDNDSLPDNWEIKYGLNPLENDSRDDNDNDTLLNIVEYYQNTDPFKEDTDNDGLSDGDEINLYMTSPINSDTDNDGLYDKSEIETYFTSPINHDTDNDAIDDLWEIQNDLNPLSNDSLLDFDNDNVNNFNEYKNMTDPQDADTDNDGLLDGRELTYLYDIKSYPDDLGPIKAMCAGENSFLILFYKYGSIKGCFFDLDGNMMGDPFLIMQYNDLESLSVAFSGEYYCIAWNGYYRRNIYAKIFNNEVVPISEDIVIVSDTEISLNFPSVSSNGDSFCIAWRKEVDYPNCPDREYKIQSCLLYPENGETTEIQLLESVYYSDPLEGMASEIRTGTASDGKCYCVIWSVYGNILDENGNIKNSFIFTPSLIPNLAYDGKHFFLSAVSGNGIQNNYSLDLGIIDSNGIIEKRIQSSDFSDSHGANLPICSEEISLVLHHNMSFHNSVYENSLMIYKNLTASKINFYYPFDLEMYIYDQAILGQRSLVIFRNNNSLAIINIGTGSSANNDDTDNDGIGDYEELNLYKTRAYLKDTDNDGIDDYSEIFTYSTDPNMRDTDCDGVPDGYELTESFSDPNNSDSDNDGLSDGFELSQYYYEGFETGDFTSMDWYQPSNNIPYIWTVVDTSSKEGNYCAKVNSASPIFDLTLTIDINADSALSFCYKTYRIGLKVKVNTKEYTYPDNENWTNILIPLEAGLNKISFGAGLLSPPVSGFYQIYRSIYLDDISIGDQMNNYISSPIKMDTDNDSLPDGWESLNQTNLIDNDTLDDLDNDGLINIREFQIGTKANNPDTDGDDFIDYSEIVAGTDPLDPSSLFRVLELFPYEIFDLIHCYVISWQSIPEKRYGIYVKSPYTFNEFVLLESNFISQGYTSYYIDQGGGDYDVIHPYLDDGPRLYKIVVEPD